MKFSKSANVYLRTLMESNKISVWEVAKVIGVHESTLLRWFRNDLDTQKSTKVIQAIANIISNR